MLVESVYHYFSEDLSLLFIATQLQLSCNWIEHGLSMESTIRQKLICWLLEARPVHSAWWLVIDNSRANTGFTGAPLQLGP